MNNHESQQGESSAEDPKDQVARLEREIDVLRRKLADPPRSSTILEERIVELQTNLTGVTDQNERLASTLREARDQIVALKEEVDRLAQPPAGFGTFLNQNEDGSADIFTGGRKLRVNVSPNVDLDQLRRGQEVMLNEALNIVDAMAFERIGDIVTLKEILEDGERALVIGHTDEHRVVQLADSLDGSALHSGDALLLEPRSGNVFEVIPRTEVEELVLDEVPDVDYQQIGGLSEQITQIRNAVELPYAHPELFRQVSLRPPRGVLLYGPPGCGKTMIAKAIANALAKKAKLGAGRLRGKSYFLSIKGPELLNMYVGETERKIRLIFQRARERASEGMPVIVFFDEMESLFRARGRSGSDVESTTVPQLLAEIDGVEGLNNVIVIGASNREDMIDPAVLRPGRLDLKIRIDRPDYKGAREILSKHLRPDEPIHPDDLDAYNGDTAAALDNMINLTIDYIYSNDASNEFLEVRYENNEREILYFSDFSSGATIRNIVDRAKMFEITRYLDGRGPLGLSARDLLRAAADEIRSIEDLTSSTNPDDWARISGRKGEKISYVRTMTRHGSRLAGRSVEVGRSNYAL
ncbi:proteasome ATPase [Kitasatospora sp. CM 4170]|uniref:AAA ATPase forming ring-shaped complexes n=1 Tax=Kitasatospora aburaviensis TaxID=67265 RepID=A0ABW1ETK0_9ACTN|nr:proteasome ATPase [Kitasatospora sp. CM 4170]WNM44086.1 proteasome ATPase [Kitasatospora sp. CM 4170]